MAAARCDVRSPQWLVLSTGGLGGLLAYLLIRHVVDPNFTDYWGYMILQIAVVLTALLGVHTCLRRSGGLSWYTHLVVTATTWADTLGNAGHLYERHASYDKVTHLGAGIALTVGAADILRALDERGVIRADLGWRLLAAMTVTLVVNIGWETYEYVGDVVFDSTRHRGPLDTVYDFAADLIGALVAAFLVFRSQPEVAPRPDVAIEGTRV